MAGTPYEQAPATAAPSTSYSGARWLARSWPVLAIALIVLAALALRLWGLRGGLPYVDHPDEPNPINYVVRMLRTGDLNPHFFQKPSLYIYLLLGVLSIHYRLGFQSGLYGALDQMTITTHSYTTIPGFFVWGRVLTVVLGGMTVAGVYVLGRRAWGLAAGLIGALFLAVSQFHIQHSQYVTTDVASALFVLLSFICAIALAREGRWRDYLLAGALAGMAASTKYNAAVIVLPIAAAHLLCWGRRSLVRGARLVGAAAATVAGFLLGTPYALLSWPEFYRGVAGQVAAYNDGSQGDIRGAWNVRGYFNFFWNAGLLVPGCIALLIGLGILLWRHERRPAARKLGLLWLSFALPYLLLLLAQSTHFLRNFLPLFVLCMLPIGVAGASLIDWVGQRGPGWRLPAVVAMLVLLLFPSAAQTLAYAQRLGRGDTRVQLLDWLAAHVPPGARIAAELKPLPGPLESPWVALDWLPEHDMAWYRRQGYAYLIGSSDAWRRWAVPDEHARLAGAPAAEFGGATPRDMFGPHLVVYATSLSPEDVPQPLASDLRIGGARLLGSAIGAPDAPASGGPLELKPGGQLALRTFWQVEQQFTADYFIFVHMLNAAGQTVAQRDAPPWQGRFPTSSWRPGTLIVDVNDLPLPADLPPGDYSIVVGMFDPASGAHPPTQVDGQPTTSSETQIGRIRIER
ncbi:MAG TPA: glycosyltransferase family 39 protein [Roseiflexaceae bacterium]|nr:glycosyltransferase family 39 protein [Roseiflexaceae bacterium]